ncbi:hypothetical protein VTO42DRAFT_3300 [Malbranchea cinnamomea]
MPVTWDTDTERRLLICCIDPATKPNWEKVAADMGSDFTAEACRQHFGKIKRSALASSTAAAASPSPPKRSRARKERFDATPTKKPRKHAEAETPVKKGGVKAEDDNEEVKVKDEHTKMEDAETA